MNNYNQYSKFYNKSSLWEKIAKYAKKAGVKLIYMALLLYYVATDPNTPAKDKAIIFAALGYFICPIDLIPDAIPVAGFSDDLAALSGACIAVANNITPEIESRAKNQLHRWCSNIDESELTIYY